MSCNSTHANGDEGVCGRISNSQARHVRFAPIPLRQLLALQFSRSAISHFICARINKSAPWFSGRRAGTRYGEKSCPDVRRAYRWLLGLEVA